MIAVIASGAACGVLGFMPLYASFHMAKRFSVISNWGYLGSMFLGLSASFVLLAAAFFICRAVAYDAVLAFVCSEVVSFLVATTIFGFVMLGKR